jgi:serine/threonine-protein kinase HipA
LNVFALDDDYVQDSQRPVLSLSLKSAVGELLTKPSVRKMRLPNFFSNLLPEGHLRQYLAQSNGIHPDREFFLLSALGKDLPGAVIAIPSSKPSSLDHLADDEDRKLERSERPFKFSLAGVQLKFSALIEAKGGLTIPTSGIGGDWIIKLPSATYGNLPENEFSMLQLAKTIGIEVPAVKLIPTKDVDGLPPIVSPTFANSLAIERFDRSASGGRIHIEDFAQVFGVDPREKYSGFSYNNIARVFWMETDERSIEEFVKRLVFNLAIGNADMHLKNWSLIYRNPQKPEIAPAYDFVSSIAYVDDPTLGLRLGRTKQMYEVEMDDFLFMAETVGLPKRLVQTTVTETAYRFQMAWKEHANDLPLTAQAKQRISDHVDKIPLFKSDSSLVPLLTRRARKKRKPQQRKAST